MISRGITLGDLEMRSVVRAHCNESRFRVEGLSDQGQDVARYIGDVITFEHGARSLEERSHLGVATTRGRSSARRVTHDFVVLHRFATDASRHIPLRCHVGGQASSFRSNLPLS